MKSERLTAYIAGSFLLGILLARSGNPLWLCPLGALSLYLCAAAHHAGRPRKGILFLLLLWSAAFFGILRFSAADRFRERYLERVEDGQSIRVQGLIYQKESKNQNTIYYLKHSFLQISNETIPCNHIQLYLDSARFPVGGTLTCRGTLKLPETAANEGNFDQKLYFESRGIDLIVYGEEAALRGKLRLPVSRALFLFRERLRNVFDSCMPELDAGILSAMLLGDRTMLSSDVKELYQSSGISHILAISGLHISLIGMLILRLLKLLHLPRTAAILLADTALFLYTLMTGATPSGLRAWLMFLLASAAPLLRRSYDSITALSVALFLLLLENPFLTGYSGFVFSFTAVFSVTAFGSVLSEASGREINEEKNNGQKAKGRIKTWILKKKTTFPQIFFSSIALQLMTLPVVMWNYFEIPLYAICLNFLILPLLGALLAAGMLGAAVGLMGLIYPARWILLIPHYILYYYGHACRLAQKLPGAVWITGKPAPWMLALYYMGLVAAFLYMDYRKKREPLLMPILLLVALAILPKHWGTELSILDVGQGDGIYLASGTGNVFVDGGSSSVKEVGKYRIEPFLKAKGVRCVDFWLVTHTDADHISGLKELLEDNFKVGTLIFSRYVVEDEALTALKSLAEKKGVPISYMEPGDRVHLGNAELCCVFPDKNYGREDKNGRSLVVVAREGTFSALLTGDISTEEERYLLENQGIKEALRQTDFYKAAHHGSKYASSAEWMELLSPTAAGISCGKKNRYGHPAEETVSRIEKKGAELFDTRFDGQIKVLPRGRRMYVRLIRTGEERIFNIS